MNNNVKCNMFLKEDNILVVRSKESIAAAMFRLMSCDSYQLLTITQICQEADISRQTFYHHFKEKEEILEYYLYSRFFTYTEKHPDTGDMTRNVHHLFENFPVSKHKLQLLKHQNIFNILSKCMADFLEYTVTRYKFSDFMEHPLYRNYYKKFLISTLITILSCWVDNQFRETADELTQMAVSMLKVI